jgi:hypothetical protein
VGHSATAATQAEVDAKYELLSVVGTGQFAEVSPPATASIWRGGPILERSTTTPGSACHARAVQTPYLGHAAGGRQVRHAIRRSDGRDLALKIIDKKAGNLNLTHTRCPPHASQPNLRWRSHRGRWPITCLTHALQPLRRAFVR